MNETLNRLYRLIYLLKKNPDGLRLRELSAELGVSMARVRTDLEILTHELPLTNWPDERSGEDYWALISPAVATPAPALTPDEAFALMWALGRQDSRSLTGSAPNLPGSLGKREQAALASSEKGCSSKAGGFMIHRKPNGWWRRWKRRSWPNGGSSLIMWMLRQVFPF